MIEIPETALALAATFGAVVLLGMWAFRLFLRQEDDAATGFGMRWVAVACVGLVVLVGWLAVGGTSFVALIGMLIVVVLPISIFPVWIQKYRRHLRAEAFSRGLVDLTVGLANGLRGGGALGQTLAHVASDLRGVVAEEITQLLDENRLGVEMATCFERLRDRMPSEDMTLLTTAIRLTLSTGGSLAEVLEKMTAMMRERRDFDERLRTMTAQGRFEAFAMGLAPMAAFGILFLIDRSMVEPLYMTTIGRAAIGAVVFLELLGFYFINKIVTIEV